MVIYTVIILIAHMIILEMYIRNIHFAYHLSTIFDKNTMLYAVHI